MESRQGNRILILGASSGIGRETARRLIDKGWTVSVAARREQPLAELKSLCPERVEYAVIDITADDAIGKLQELAERTGGIDVYFHAVGIGRQNRRLELQTETDTVETNVVAFTQAMNWAYHYFERKGKGHIAVISSIAATKGLGPAPSYSATKAFQVHYIEALEQLARQERMTIRFTDIRPGFVDTPLLGDGNYYPMKMDAAKVGRRIVRAIERGEDVVVIDWRFRALVALWRLVPRWIWKRIRL